MMFIIINLLDALATIIHYVLTIYMWLIIVRALLSWVNPDPVQSHCKFSLSGYGTGAFPG